MIFDNKDLRNTEVGWNCCKNSDIQIGQEKTSLNYSERKIDITYDKYGEKLNEFFLKASCS